MTGVRLQLRGVGKTYPTGDSSLDILNGLDLDVNPGDRLAIVGPSGCGKSTLMHLLGLLDRPTTGSIEIDGEEVGSLTEARRDRIRNRKIGFVFQSHNLLSEHTALGNVAVPVRLGGGSEQVAHERARILLEAVGLGHRIDHLPTKLSGGERQRVALARALVMGPGLVLADEPTGNLDPATAAGVFHLLLELNAQLGSTLVVVTHSDRIAARFPRRLTVEAGKLVEVA